MIPRLKDILAMQNVLFVLFIVLAISLSWNTVKVIQRNYSLQEQVNVLETEVTLLELENQNVEYNINYLKSDEYLELAARDKFNRAAKGESIILLPKEEAKKIEDQSVLGENTNPQKPQYQENFDQWMYFLFGRQPS